MELQFLGCFQLQVCMLLPRQRVRQRVRPLELQSALVAAAFLNGNAVWLVCLSF